MKTFWLGLCIVVASLITSYSATLRNYKFDVPKLNEEFDNVYLQLNTNEAKDGLHIRLTDNAFDVSESSITTNGAWHDLDLSSIVPSDAKIIVISGFIQDDNTSQRFSVRQNGSTLDDTVRAQWTQAINVPIGFTFIVPCDANQIIEYNGSSATFTHIRLVVLGWIK